MLTFSPVLFQIIAMGTYVFASTTNMVEFDAGKAFVSLMIFNIIYYPIWVFVFNS